MERKLQITQKHVSALYLRSSIIQIKQYAEKIKIYSLKCIFQKIKFEINSTKLKKTVTLNNI